MEREIEKFIGQFEHEYGHTSQRTEFFIIALPEFAKKVSEQNVDMDKELNSFIDEYKKRQLGGFNATYGSLYHWLIDFAATFLKVDAFDLRTSILFPDRAKAIC